MNNLETAAREAADRLTAWAEWHEMKDRGLPDCEESERHRNVALNYRALAEDLRAALATSAVSPYGSVAIVADDATPENIAALIRSAAR